MMKNGKSNQRIRTLVRTALLTLAALIVGVNIYSLNAARLTGNVVPMPFGVGMAVVLSGSMEPELSVGDLVLVIEREEYEVDDIVVYQDGKTAISHRIVSMTDEEVVLRGDANDSEDAPITHDRIKGEVAFAIPLLGFLINAIKTPIATVAILLLAVFLMERSFHAQKRKDEEDLAAIQAEIDALKQQRN